MPPKKQNVPSGSKVKEDKVDYLAVISQERTDRSVTPQRLLA
jgi:hypothetical protein